jgi:hypothetical protein
MLYYTAKEAPPKSKKEGDNQIDEYQWTSSFWKTKSL